MSNAKARVIVYTADDVETDKDSLRLLVGNFARGTWADFCATNNATAGKASKFAAGVAVGGSVASYFETYTPLAWMLKGFGPLPAEFTKSGAIRVFQFTTMERALLVGKAALAKFVLVTVAYEGGVLIGSMINQALPESTRDAIGGTINEIVNEGGWKLLYQHPFGVGL